MMEQRKKIDLLCSLSIGDLQRIYKSNGYKLSELEEILSPPGSVATTRVTWTLSYFCGIRPQIINQTDIELRRDGDSLYIEFVYSVRAGGVVVADKRVRYYLVKRESNLIRGKYRYYFMSPTGGEIGLFSKLYVIDGEIVPRTRLQREGLLYSSQCESHSQREIKSILRGLV